MLTAEIDPHQELLEIVKTRKLKWFGHTTRHDGLAKDCLQGTVHGGRKRGRPRKMWKDNIKEWTGLSFADATRMAENRELWREMVRASASSKGPQQRPTSLWSSQVVARKSVLFLLVFLTTLKFENKR